MEQQFDRFLIRVNRAVQQLRAIRALPQTEGTERAQRKVLNSLNISETTEVALRLAAIEDLDKLAIAAPGSEKETSRG